MSTEKLKSASVLFEMDGASFRCSVNASRDIVNVERLDPTRRFNGPGMVPVNLPLTHPAWAAARRLIGQAEVPEARSASVSPARNRLVSALALSRQQLGRPSATDR